MNTPELEVTITTDEYLGMNRRYAGPAAKETVLSALAVDLKSKTYERRVKRKYKKVYAMLSMQMSLSRFAGTCAIKRKKIPTASGTAFLSIINSKWNRLN